MVSPELGSVLVPLLAPDGSKPTLEGDIQPRVRDESNFRKARQRARESQSHPAAVSTKSLVEEKLASRNVRGHAVKKGFVSAVRQPISNLSSLTTLTSLSPSCLSSKHLYNPSHILELF